MTDSPLLPRRTVSRPSHAWNPTSATAANDGQTIDRRSRWSRTAKKARAEDHHPDDRGDGPVDPLDPGLRIVQGRDDLAVAEGPVRAAEARIGDPDDDADRDQRKGGHEGRGSKLLEAGHGTAILSRAGVRTAPAATSGEWRYATGHATTSTRREPPGRAAARRRLRDARHRPARRPSSASPDGSPAAGAACPTSPAPDAANLADWGAPATAPTLTPLLVSNFIVCGQARILFLFLDSDSQDVSAPDRTVSVAFYDLAQGSGHAGRDRRWRVHLDDPGRARHVHRERGPARGRPVGRRVHDRSTGIARRDDPRHVRGPRRLAVGRRRRAGSGARTPPPWRTSMATSRSCPRTRSRTRPSTRPRSRTRSRRTSRSC